MCSVAGAALGLQALGGLNSASAAQASASANRSSLMMQASVADLNAQSVQETASYNSRAILQTAEINARLAETAAQRTLLAGQRDVQKSRLSTAALRSSQRARMAANGIVLDEGTAENIITSTDLMGEVDAQTIEQNAISSAWGYRTQSSLDTAEAKARAAGVINQGEMQSIQYRTQGAYSRSSGNAVNPGQAYTNSLIGSAGSVASSWYSMSKQGAFSGLDTPQTDPRAGVRGQRGY